MPQSNPPIVAMVSSYVPRLCGIATFAHDLATAYAQHVHHTHLSEAGPVRITALNEASGVHAYGDEVQWEIQQADRDDYVRAAEQINASDADVVNLQHEYGLFGGEEGEYIVDLIANVTKPIVSTLHTVLADPKPKQKEIMIRICEASSHVVVMAEKARQILSEVYGVSTNHVRLIPHGVPDVSFGETEPFKNQFGLSGRPMILTFGLLAPAKGIETGLQAVARVVPEHPDVAYVVLGVTHPACVEKFGESYREYLQQKVVDLGIEDNVFFHDRYVSFDDLREYLQAADIYLTPYKSKDQICSGTLAYALACGKAIISTPYWYAQELLAGGRGRLADFDDHKGFALHLQDLLDRPEACESVRRSAYAFGRSMVWSNVAQLYVDTFVNACNNIRAIHEVRSAECDHVLTGSAMNKSNKIDLGDVMNAAAGPGSEEEASVPS